MTKKEKAILKLAQKWAKASCTNRWLWDAPVKAAQRRACGRALLKILEP